MANNLVSPGVQVSVIDESNYAPTALGTVPFIIMATAQDKTNNSGTTATGTTKANAGKIFTVGSQRELTSLFGMPTFPSDASGNRIFGSELAEYGLHAAFNVLDIISNAYVMRADIDLNQIQATTSRPTADAASGTIWLNTAISSWGVFEWDDVNQVFAKIVPTVITNSSNLSAGVPKTSFGVVGDYAVNVTNSVNTLYYKNYNSTWVEVGTTAWQQSVPVIQATVRNYSGLTVGHTFTINSITVTVGAGGDAALVTNVNGLNIPGVTAGKINGYFSLFATPAAKSNGTVVDGGIKLVNGTGTALSNLGIPSIQIGNVNYGPIIQFSAHSSVPLWKMNPTTGVAFPNNTPRPSGSIWIKTTNFNYGANLATYIRNGITSTWDLIPNLVFSSSATALFGLDPTKGGLSIAKGSLFTRYDATNNFATYETYYRYDNGPTTATGTISNPTLTAGNTFTINATQIGSSSYIGLITITVPASPNNNVAGVAAAISTANISQLDGTVLVQASVSATGNLVITHTTGGTILAVDTSGTPLADMGFYTNSGGIASTIPTVYPNYTNTGIAISNWVPIADVAGITYIEQNTAPTSIPTDGTLWYYSGVLEADIMINVNNVWKGYKNVTSSIKDARGYDLSMTDPNGPIFSFSKPTAQTDGTPLVSGDIWIDTSTFDSYPILWRYQTVNSVSQWVQIDNTDSTTENGIVFGDARWDGTGATNIFLDDITPITTLLTSDYVDLDAPNPALYPNGCLLFNTRRSSNNVKKYVQNYFTTDNFPQLSLPATVSTWQSFSGKKWNNVPYFGRQAVRNVVISAMSEAVTNSTELREEGKDFNLLVSPGYNELLEVLITLNNDRKNTGFIIGEVPMGLSTDSTTVENYLLDSSGSGITGEDGLVLNDSYTAVFYPGVAIMNALDGVGSIAVPMSSVMLRTFIRSDQIGEVWFAPAGNTRGVIDGVTSVGYIDRTNNNAFVSTGVPQSLRDLLYTHQVNPITFFPNVGRINYGNHTRQADATALDRINVARLVCYIRNRIEAIIRPLVFEPNDKLTRDTAKSLVDKLLIDITSRRGLYDHLVVCDVTNNTNATIDNNELHIDVAIEPVKAVEFIYIPVRIKGTGQIASGNLTPSLPLG